MGDLNRRQSDATMAFLEATSSTGWARHIRRGKAWQLTTGRGCKRTTFRPLGDREAPQRA